MMITDPREAHRPFFAHRVAPLLNGERDASMVLLMLQCAAVAVVGVVLLAFVRAPYIYGAAPLYWVLMAQVMDRFTLLLHCTSHRRLFKTEHDRYNSVIPLVLAPFFGQTPNTYFAHHMGMHHKEENLSGDLSSTIRFQRNRFGHWLRYWGRFMTVGVFELSGYFKSRNQKKMFRRVIVGEGIYWSAVALLAWWNPLATLAVLVLPLVGIRSAMMMGNWAQHSFVCQEQPENPYRSSITCINTRYNRRCFNDGYHILHHVKPRAHWTEHPVEFEKSRDEYGRQDAIVFDGIDFFQVWLFLMVGRWDILAKHFVHLPEAPARSQDEVIAFLKERTRPLAPREQGVGNEEQSSVSFAA
jgi:fatty acid desaturase